MRDYTIWPSRALAVDLGVTYLRKGSSPILEIRSTYCACPARTFRGKSDRRIARPAEYFLGGAQPSGPVKEALDELTDTRQRPIGVSHWDRAGYVVGGR